MKKWLWVVVVLAGAAPALAQYQIINGFVSQGGKSVTVGGLPPTASTYLQTYPGATVTICVSGTSCGTLATIYSSSSGGAQSNPFTSDPNTAYWAAWVPNGTYDIRYSGKGISSPYTAVTGISIVLTPQLGNGTNVIDAMTQTGTGTHDMGDKINQAISTICATYTWGIVHAEGFGTGAMAENVTVGSPPNVCAIHLFLPQTVNATGTARFLLANGAWVTGQGKNTEGGVTGTTINWPGGYPLFSSASSPSSQLTDVRLEDFRAINFNYYGSGNSNLNDIAFDFPSIADAGLYNVTGTATYGAIIGSVFGCNCYIRIYDCDFTGWATGLTLGPTANSIDVLGGSNGGSTAEYISPTSLNGVHLIGNDTERAGVGLDLAGQRVYYSPNDQEGIGSGSPYTWVWQPSTYYVSGNTVTDSNGNEWLCKSAGTSGLSSPFPGSPSVGPPISDGTTITWLYVPNPTLILDQGESYLYYAGPYIPYTDVQMSGTETGISPEVSATLGSPLASFGGITSFNGQLLAGGVQFSPILINAAPTITYHCALTCGTRTSALKYQVNINSVTYAGTSGQFGQTGLSPQGVNYCGGTSGSPTCPNTLGQVQVLTLLSGGSGYSNSGTRTLNCPTAYTQPTVNYTASGGVVNSVSIATAGVGVGPGTCTDASAPGGGTAFTVTVDSNYGIITPSTVNVTGFENFVFKPPAGVGSYDIVNAAGNAIGGAAVGTGLTAGNWCPVPGSFCDYGNTPVSYSAPARNSTGDAYFGSNQTGAVPVHMSFNQFALFQGTLGPDGGGVTLQANRGNQPGDLALAPSGSATSSALSLCYTAACGSGSYAIVKGTAAGIYIQGIGTSTPLYSQNNTLDDGSGNMKAVGNVTVKGGSNIVYRCATAGTLPAGTLTITPGGGNCTTSTDTGLRVN